VGRAAQLQRAVAPAGGRPRVRLAGVAAGGGRRPHRPLRRRAGRSETAGRDVADAEAGLPAERLGPHCVVDAAADPQPPRLAARHPRAGRLPEHGVDPVRDVLAGHGGPGVRRERPGRARPQVLGGLRRRLGRRRAAAGLDRRRHAAVAGTDRAR
jgi:hypothetical protein